MRNIRKNCIIFAASKPYNNMAKTATIKTIEQSEKVGLYSICFDGNDLTEYEKFVQKFMDDATLNKDFQMIFRAINRIVANVPWSVSSVPKAKWVTTSRLCPSTPRYCVCTAFAYPTKSS